MSGYVIKSRLINEVAQAIGASETDVELTNLFKVSADDSTRMNIAVTSASNSGTSTVNVQSSPDGGTSWVTAASGTLSDGTTYFEFDAVQEADVAMWPLARIVVTTAGASGTTISAVYATTRL